MEAIRILHAGLFTTIQDGGRIGYTKLGIPRSGFLDPKAAGYTNILLNKEPTSALLEMIGVGIKFEALDDISFAVHGAKGKTLIDSKEVNPNRCFSIHKGCVVEIKSFDKGRVAYLGFNGKLKTDEFLNSSSTLSTVNVGGKKGGRLKKHDVLYLENIYDLDDTQLEIGNYALPSNIPIVSVYKGPEFSSISNPNVLAKLIKVSKDSNRMAALIESESIQIQIAENFASKPLWPGMIQCTPSGKLMVMLQDGPTTGGYPRVLFLQKEQLCLFNQIPAGGSFKFKIIED